MRPLLPVVLLVALLAACDASEPPKPAAVPEPLKPIARAEQPPAPPPVAAPQPSPDEQLAERVKQALRDARAVPGQGVDATVDGGVVTLYGTVPSREDRGKVGEFVAGIGGVKSVVNKLVVVRGS
jgi:hypothetical protein